MLASLAVLVFVIPRYEFPHNVQIWLDWSRIVFVLSAVVIMLALIGRTRARVQILLCAIAMCWACVILASLA